MKFVAFAASLYFNIKSGHDGRPSRAQKRKQFAVIGALARKLSRKIGKLDELSHRVVWAPHEGIGFWMDDARITKTKFESTIHREEVSDPGFMYLGVPDIVEALAVLGIYANEVVKQLPRARHGATPDEALRMWIVNAASFWEGQLNRRFTYDSQAGQPVSKAFRFCCDALRPVAPDIPISTVGTYVRDFIGGRLRPAGKIPDKN